MDEQGAKAAIYNLNRIGQPPQELEEAWIVHALVREDGLSQVQAAELLGRHKSWVNRRLALLEQLCEGAKEELRLGLLTPAIARQLTRLPRGNQQEALQTTRESSLTCRELAGVVDLLLASSTREQRDFVLRDPRRALRQSQEQPVPTWDPRMSPHGNRIAKQLAYLLDHLAKMQTWLAYRGRGELMAYDRQPCWCQAWNDWFAKPRWWPKRPGTLLQEFKQVMSKSVEHEIIRRWQSRPIDAWHRRRFGDQSPSRGQRRSAAINSHVTRAGASRPSHNGAADARASWTRSRQRCAGSTARCATPT